MYEIFNIETKEFTIKVDDLSYGGLIVITKTISNQFFHISLELRCVARSIKAAGASGQQRTSSLQKIHGGFISCVVGVELQFQRCTSAINKMCAWSREVHYCSPRLK